MEIQEPRSHATRVKLHKRWSHGFNADAKSEKEQALEVLAKRNRQRIADAGGEDRVRQPALLYCTSTQGTAIILPYSTIRGRELPAVQVALGPRRSVNLYSWSVAAKHPE